MKTGNWITELEVFQIQFMQMPRIFRCHAYLQKMTLIFRIISSLLYFT